MWRLNLKTYRGPASEWEDSLQTYQVRCDGWNGHQDPCEGPRWVICNLGWWTSEGPCWRVEGNQSMTAVEDSQRKSTAFSEHHLVKWGSRLSWVLLVDLPLVPAVGAIALPKDELIEWVSELWQEIWSLGFSNYLECAVLKWKDTWKGCDYPLIF